MAFGIADTRRAQDLTLLRIRLDTPGLSFATSRAGGPDVPTRPGHQVNTDGRSVSDSLLEEPGALLAINANFFWPCCEPAGRSKVGMSLFGLAVSDGAVVSDPRAVQHKAGVDCADAPAVPDADSTGSAAMLIDGANRVRFTMQTAADPIPGDVRVAVAGGPQPLVATASGCGANDDYPPMTHVPGPAFLVRGGQIEAAPAADPPEIVAARTFVGTSADGQYLFLATIDGGEHAGAAFFDEASWLQLAGASEGLNLDGGGSTAMAMRTASVAAPPAPCPASGQTQLLDVPYGFVRDGKEVRCGERLVGNQLKVIVGPR